MSEETFARSVVKSFKGFLTIVPMLLAIILLVGLVDLFISQEMLASVFNGNMFFDTLVGTLAGGISVGQPVVSTVTRASPGSIYK